MEFYLIKSSFCLIRYPRKSHDTNISCLPTCRIYRCVTSYVCYRTTWKSGIYIWSIAVLQLKERKFVDRRKEKNKNSLMVFLVRSFLYYFRFIFTQEYFFPRCRAREWEKYIILVLIFSVEKYIYFTMFLYGFIYVFWGKLYSYIMMIVIWWFW